MLDVVIPYIAVTAAGHEVERETVVRSLAIYMVAL